MTISYNGLDLSKIVPYNLKIYYYNGTTWQLVGGVVDTFKKEIRVLVTHFSTYGLFEKSNSTSSEMNSGLNVETVLSIAPNPVNANTMVRFSLKEGSSVLVDIYNLRVEKVRSLVSGTFTSGSHLAVWDGRDNTGKSLSSGMYMIKLKAGSRILMQKAGLIR